MAAGGGRAVGVRGWRFGLVVQAHPRSPRCMSRMSVPGPWWRHCGGGGTFCNKACLGVTVALHRRQVHSGLHSCALWLQAGAQCIRRSGNCVHASSRSAWPGSARMIRWQLPLPVFVVTSWRRRFRLSWDKRAKHRGANGFRFNQVFDTSTAHRSGTFYIYVTKVQVAEHGCGLAAVAS